MAFKAGDRVIASRYVGPPREDGTVVEVGEERQQALSGETEVIGTATVRFADGQTATVAAESLLPGGRNYIVKTPDGDTWCDSAAAITEAIRSYVESGPEGASLSKVSLVLMPPGQRTGAGQHVSPADFHVEI